MSYILMTKRQYLEISRGVALSSCFRDSDFDQTLGRFKANHPQAYERQIRESENQNKLYKKFGLRRPSAPLSNNALLEAIKTCSERPSKCFYFKETLSELGYHNIYSYEDRYSSLMDVTKKGYAVLVPKGLAGGGGGRVVTVKRKVNAFDDAVAGFVVNSLVDIGAAATGVMHGALQFSKDGDIREAYEVMNDTRAQISEKLKYNVDESTQEVIDNNPVIQTASYALENTVGNAINYASENLPEDVVFYGGSTLAVGLELSGIGGKAKPLFSKGMGIEKASQELIDSVSKKRTVIIAKEGSEEMRYLNMIGAEANVGGANMTHIILRESPSKAAVLEEFLHGTQQRLGVIDKLGHVGLGSAETHVKDFMMRHSKMLGLSKEDVMLLKELRDAGL